jgi:hypothetical protein
MGRKSVFYRCKHSKRAVALLGVVLAFSPAAQQCHLFCYLGACKAAAADLCCEEHVASCDHSCKHCQPCKVPVTNDSQEPAGGFCGPPHGCPCPETCWCQQSPSPLDLPRGSTVPMDVVLQHHAVCVATSVSTSVSDASPPSDWLSNSGDTADSALQRCSLLSRFLI